MISLLLLDDDAVKKSAKHNFKQIRVLDYSYPSPLDPLSHEWERGPIAAGLALPLARLRERGSGG